MTPEQESKWRERKDNALEEFIESGALATSICPNYLRDAYFRAGFKACVKIAQEMIKERDELIKELLLKTEELFKELIDIKLHMAMVHNNDQLTANNVRAELLVLASRISYQVESANPWSIKPTLEKAKKLVGGK